MPGNVILWFWSVVIMTKPKIATKHGQSTPPDQSLTDLCDNTDADDWLGHAVQVGNEEGEVQHPG